MAAAAGGGIKVASANVWAMLADEDPGDSEAAKRLERETKEREAKRLERETKEREAAEYRHQLAAAKASKATVGKARKLQPPVAVANGEAANTDVVATGEQKKSTLSEPAAMNKQTEEEEATDSGSDDEFDGEEDEESSSCCRTMVRMLLRAAVAAVLIAFWVHAAVPPHTAT